MNREEIEKLKYERYEELNKEELKYFERLISKYSKSLLAYNLIMEQQENKKYKEVIDKLRKRLLDLSYLNDEIIDIELLDILKEVE